MVGTLRSHRPLFAIFLLSLAAASAPAAGWPVPRGPSHEPDPFRYDPKHPPAVPAGLLDDAAACVLYAGNTYTVEPDGTVEAVTHELTRLAGRKGIEKLGEYRNITYDPSFQTLTLHEARIFKADGRVVPVEARHAQLRDVGTDFQVYDHEKQLILSFPSLEVGDVIEVKWTVRGRNPEHGGRFFTRYTFGDVQFPVLTDEFRVRVPRDMPLRHAVTGGKLTPTAREDGTWKTLAWRATNTPRLPQDDNLPPREDLRPSVVCSTFASWDEVARWKQRLRGDCFECTPEVRKVVAEVTRGLTDPEAKARALTFWLRQKVRYVSVGEKHDYTPHAPAEVLANRFGDCKDTSQLLAVMLREAGVAVELATLGALDDGQVLPEVPSPWGTHAIVLATIGGKEHWVDTTATLAGWDFLPREDRGRLCYLFDDRGRLHLKRTPGLTTDDYRVEQTTEVWVGPDGTSRCRRRAVFHGLAAMAQRDGFLEVPAGERRRLVTSELQDSNSRTRLARLDLDEAALRDNDRPVRVETEFEIPGHFTGTPAKEGSVSDSKVWGRLLACNLDYERPVALNLLTPCDLTHRYVVHLPPACVVDELPSDKEVRSAWGTFARKVSSPDGGRLVEIVFHTHLDRPVVEPSGFDEFRRFHEDVAGAYRAWLSLKSASEPSDAPLMEAALTLAPGDAVTAATLGRIYHEHDQDADARRVLRRALAYCPEDAGLWEVLADCAADGPEREEVLRERSRRFPEGRHVLELAAYLVGRGKHKETRELLEPLTKKGPAAQRAQAHYQLARGLCRAGDASAALEHLDAAEEADADTVHTAQALLLRGNVLEELGKPDEASKAYEDALSLEHDNEGALAGLVRLDLASGNRMHALEHLRHYTLAVGSSRAGLLQAAEFHLRLERWDDALDLARQAGSKADAGRAHRVLGLASWHKGDLEKAARHFREADKDAATLEALLEADLSLGNVEELSPLVRRAETTRPLPASLRRVADRARAVVQRRTDLAKNLAAPSGKAREWSEALDACVCAEDALKAGAAPARVEQLLHRALDKGFEVGPALALRGRLSLDHGRLGRALADAERAVRLSPSYPAGYYVRGRVRQERGDPGAVADLLRAAELTGRSDAEVLHALGEALFEAGRRDEALEAQRLAAKLRPGDVDIAEQLSRFEKGAPNGGGSP
jgi:tetratricopeptide (TPR) repeat protein/transglutaminase-like putative cysteine protease